MTKQYSGAYLPIRVKPSLQIHFGASESSARSLGVQRKGQKCNKQGYLPSYQWAALLIVTNTTHYV